MTFNKSIIRAFSEDDVVRLTDLSKGQLRYWDKTGFFSPRHAAERRRAPYSRIYTFRDVVGLRTLGKLRKEHHVSLQHLREVAERLSHLGDDLWSRTTLYVLDRKVYFPDPESGSIRRVVDGQYAMIPLAAITNEVAEEALKLRDRSEDQIGRIDRHRFVARNAWVFAGTRIPIGAIRRFRQAGYSIEQIQEEYPSLTRHDIEAALDREESLAKSA